MAGADHGSGKAAHLVADVLRRAIVDGSLPTGQAIRERDLVSAHGVSRDERVGQARA